MYLKNRIYYYNNIINNEKFLYRKKKIENDRHHRDQYFKRYFNRFSNLIFIISYFFVFLYN